MTTDEHILWQKIDRFNLDDRQADFTFSARLARENGWKPDYAQRVIQEYKRFIFLCCISEQGITPSDPVDQAWHLHLTYTRSYWIDFCQRTLGREIHHHPTRGGEAEAGKFDGYYTYSQKLYTVKFDEPPPADIWPDNITRFSDTDFQRFNLRTHRLISRQTFTWFKKALYIIATIVGLTVSGLLLLVLPSEAYLPVGLFFVITIFVYAGIKYGIVYNGNDNDNDITGCGPDVDDCDGHGHGGHDGHGCGSGCSGCSGSGCSGCGSGGGH